MDVRLPDGTILRNVPDGTTQEEIAQRLRARGIDIGAMANKHAQPGEQERRDLAVREFTAPLRAVRDMAAGGVRGAGSIGATLLAPLDAAARAVGVQNDFIGRTDRREAMDAGLRELMGADPDSLAYGGGKLAAEIAGTAAVGGTLGRAAVPALARIAPSVAPRVAQALATGGMRTGAAPATLGQRVGDLGLRTAAGATTGGASAALIDPDAAATGATLGALLPGGAQALGAAGRLVGQGAAHLRAAVSDAGARQQAVKQVREVLGPGVRQAVGDIQTYYPKGAEAIPVSAAGITQSRPLAQLEQASRLRSPTPWGEFDQRQAGEVWKNVQRATAEADDLGARFAQRAQNWADNWGGAEGSVKPRVWAKRMGQLGTDIETGLRSTASSNPEVRRVLEALKDEVIRVGPEFSPGHLQQIRAQFNGRHVPGDPNAFKSAPRDQAAVKSLIAELDDILNASTGGKWDKVRQGYAADSKAVHAAKAAGKVRGAFVDDATGRVLGSAADAAGDVPRITEAGIGRAMNAARLPDKSLALSADANARLEATLAALRRQQIIQQVKRASTAGGGSDTASNLLRLGGGQSGLLGDLLSIGRRAAMGRTDDQLAGLLANPDQLAGLLAAQPRQMLAPGLLDQGLLFGVRAVPALAADR